MHWSEKLKIHEWKSFRDGKLKFIYVSVISKLKWLSIFIFITIFQGFTKKIADKYWKYFHFYLSLSNLLRRPILRAVCRTIVPKARLETTIPSTRGVAKFILDTGPWSFTRSKPLPRAWRKITWTSDGSNVLELSRPVFVQGRRSAVMFLANEYLTVRILTQFFSRD